MSEFMLIKLVDIAGTTCLQFVGKFANKEEATDYVAHDSIHFIVPAEQLFWEISTNPKEQL